ncbi:MAG: DUF4065 domain-containing protein [Candidatus Omnitrophica bacterium]|nr:DUF4065 domain-containing protein [Candidatus Omnitrophota bacterium]MCB9748023.1 DUF4065 domain-containing protein [Candidatus Omnitrophota bacterium]
MSENFNKKLGQRIRELRGQYGFNQEKVAKHLGIKRTSFSQIEIGERKISVEEIAKLSKLFNIPTDSLLDLNAEIKVELMKEPPKKEKQELRISVPQNRIDKFKEVLLYILDRVGSKSNVGETVIYKLLYFIDFDFYELYEEQLIGASYQKNHYGPTPVEFAKIVSDMEQSEEVVKVKEQYYQFPQTKYLPLRKPDLSKLKANEIKLIDEVLEKLSDYNANKISEYSHDDVPWMTTDEGEIIDYESVFYRTKPYSVRSYSEEEVQ